MSHPQHLSFLKQQQLIILLSLPVSGGQCLGRAFLGSSGLGSLIGLQSDAGWSNWGQSGITLFVLIESLRMVSLQGLVWTHSMVASGHLDTLHGG